MSEKEVNIEAKQGATVKIEHKRGSGTRDQDKVQIKVHESDSVTPEGLENACFEAVEKATSTMKELRESVYTGEKFNEGKTD